MALAFLLSTTAAPGPARAADPTPRRADVLIIEHVAGLQIYDSYQQPLRDLPAAGIRPFTPFVILAWTSTMGDGFTPCVRAVVAGKHYAILRGPARNDLAASKPLGYIRTVRDAELLDDTIRVHSPRSIEFHAPSERSRIPVRTADVFVRIFRSGTRIYVMRLDADKTLGWLVLPAGPHADRWVIVHEPAPSQSVSDADVVSRVSARIAAANTTLRNLYKVLDNETGTRRRPPQWEIDPRGRTITCRLTASGAPESHAGSTRELARSLEGALLGTGWVVRQSPGRITIAR